MADDSLYDAIRLGGYDASLITTYNAYFPFYEEVILRRLRASDCRHNVVLADAKQCAVSLSDSFSAPRRAGTEYTLVPVRSDGAFHPKILLLVGRTKGAIYVGSHNLTLSGFGYNRELTNLIEFNPKKDAGAVACAKAVWGTIRNWLNAQQGYLPRATLDAVLAVRNHAAWLDRESTVEPDPAFLAQCATTAPLLEQIAGHAPKSVKRIVVVGAFFDSKLQFLKALAARWPKARLVSGVEPDTVSLPGKRIARKEFDFRDASELAGRSGYLHAKAIFFEGKDGDHLLVSGSANPSSPAWMGTNEEAIILRKGSGAFKAAEELGLLAITSFKSIESEQWDVIRTELPQEAAVQKARSAIVACETDVGFEIPRGAFRSAPLRCTAKTGDNITVELALPAQSVGETLVIAADRQLRRDARRLEFDLKGGGVAEAIVHHTTAIEDLARSTKEAQFRAALQGLSTGSTDIARLVSAVEKVIFDEAEVAAAEISTRSRAESAASSSRDGRSNMKPETLAVAIEDTKQAKRHRRLLKSTDMGYLLDVLIHRLGIGLSRNEATVDSHGRSEEGQIDQDDDDAAEPDQKDIDDSELAALCRRKLRKLITRMKAQMDKADGNGTSTPTVLVQLVAVLAVMRELRTIERHDRWKRARAQLVDPQDEKDLLEHVLLSFFGRGRDLYASIVRTLGTDRFDEIARLKGLLMWLTWDCDLTLENRFGIAEHRQDVEERLWSKAALLELVQILSGDGISLEEARGSILSVADAGEHQAAIRWIEECEAWSREVERALVRMRENILAPLRPKHIGSLAFANAISRPRLRVVSSVSDSSVTLFDFYEEIPYRPDRVSSAEPASAAGAVKA